MKRLYVVRDIQEDYCYVVKAETEKEAIEIVKRNTKHDWEWEASLADNAEVWE